MDSLLGSVWGAFSDAPSPSESRSPDTGPGNRSADEGNAAMDMLVHQSWSDAVRTVQVSFPLRPGPRHGASSSGSLLSGGLLAGASTGGGVGGEERMDGVVFMVTSTSDNTKIGVKSVPRSIEDFEWLHAQLLGSYAGCALQPLELSPAGDPPPLARVLAAAAAATTQGHAGASSGLVSTLAGAGMAPPGEHAQWMKWQLERYLRAQISHMEIKHAAALKAFCLADADDFALVRRFSPRGLAPADVNVFVQKMTHAAWAEGGAARGTAPSSVMEPDDGIGLESCRAVLGLVRYTYSLESVLVALRDAASELQQHVQAGQAKRYAFGIALLDLARDESELNANACDDEGFELSSTLAHVQDDSDDSDDERSDIASAGRSDLDGAPAPAPNARAPSPLPPQQQHPRPIGELPKFSALIELNASAEVLALDRLLLEIESHALSTASIRVALATRFWKRQALAAARARVARARAHHAAVAGLHAQKHESAREIERLSVSLPPPAVDDGSGTRSGRGGTGRVDRGKGGAGGLARPPKHTRRPPAATPPRGLSPPPYSRDDAASAHESGPDKDPLWRLPPAPQAGMPLHRACKDAFARFDGTDGAPFGSVPQSALVPILVEIGPELMPSPAELALIDELLSAQRAARQSEASNQSSDANGASDGAADSKPSPWIEFRSVGRIAAYLVHRQKFDFDPFADEGDDETFAARLATAAGAATLGEDAAVTARAAEPRGPGRGGAGASAAAARAEAAAAQDGPLISEPVAEAEPISLTQSLLRDARAGLSIAGLHLSGAVTDARIAALEASADTDIAAAEATRAAAAEAFRVAHRRALRAGKQFHQRSSHTLRRIFTEFLELERRTTRRRYRLLEHILCCADAPPPRASADPATMASVGVGGVGPEPHAPSRTPGSPVPSSGIFDDLGVAADAPSASFFGAAAAPSIAVTAEPARQIVRPPHLGIALSHSPTEPSSPRRGAQDNIFEATCPHEPGEAEVVAAQLLAEGWDTTHPVEAQQA